MKTIIISEKKTLNISITIKILLISLLITFTIYKANEFLREFAQHKNEKTEQKSNKSKSQTKNDSTSKTKKSKSNNNDNWNNKKKNGKNEPHKNQDVKESIKKQIDDYEKQINELKQKPNKSKEESKLLKILKNTKKRLQKNINQRGETHWRK